MRIKFLSPDCPMVFGYLGECVTTVNGRDELILGITGNSHKGFLLLF